MALVTAIGYFLACLIALGDCAVTLEVIPSEFGQTKGLEVICKAQKGNPLSRVLSITISHSVSADLNKFTYLASINSSSGQGGGRAPSTSMSEDGVIDNSGVSYLRLTWGKLTSQRRGVYRCEVRGLDKQGKPATITQLAAASGTGDDNDQWLAETLDNFTAHFEQSLEAMRRLCENKTQEIDALKNRTSNLETSVGELSVDLTNKIQSLDDDMTSSIASLKSSLDEAKETFSAKINEIDALYNEVQSAVKANENRTNIRLNELTNKQNSLQDQLNEANRNSSESFRVLAENISVLTKKVERTVNLTESYQKSQTLTNADLQNQITSLRINLATMFRMESGSFSCGEFVNNFPLVLDYTTRGEDVAVTFRSPFAKPPRIVLTMSFLDISKERNFRFFHHTYAVTTRGFVGRCAFWHDSIIHKVTLDWIAISQP